MSIPEGGRWLAAGAGLANAFDDLDSWALEQMSGRERAEQMRARIVLLRYLTGLRDQGLAGDGDPDEVDALAGVCELVGTLHLAVTEAIAAAENSTSTSIDRTGLPR